jgi:hypothetical protein
MVNGDEIVVFIKEKRGIFFELNRFKILNNPSLVFLPTL